MSRISIIGMGWLGVQLAEKLKDKGFEVTGTVSSEKKKRHLLPDFKELSVVELDKISTYQSLNLKDVDYFVLTIPPSASMQYADKMKRLISYLLEAYPKANLIYTSSTSVYGSEPRNVSEESETLPQSSNAKEIIKVENYLIDVFSARSCIIRLGGLVGKDRHPVKYLSGKTGISKGKAPVNLVHAEDVCRLIVYLIQYEKRAGVYNLCCPSHPPKMEYYAWVAEQLKLPKPNFNTFDNQMDKVVSCNAIKKINFELNYKSPYDFPIIN